MLQKYRNHIVYTILVGILFFSCTENEKVKPPILKESEMVEILKILFVSEVKAIDTYELSIQKSKYIEQYVYPELFDSLGINSKDFYQSYNYYSENPKELTRLLDSVIVAIDSMKVEEVVFPKDKKSLEKTYQEIHAIEQLREQERMNLPRRNDQN
jgi:hypothetical protein